MAPVRRMRISRIVARREAAVRSKGRLAQQVRNNSRVATKMRHKLALGKVDRFLAERLVGPETHDGQAKRVNGDLIVLHVLSEDIGDAGGPSLSLPFWFCPR